MTMVDRYLGRTIFALVKRTIQEAWLVSHKSGAQILRCTHPQKLLIGSLGRSHVYSSQILKEMLGENINCKFSLKTFNYNHG